MWKRKNLLRGSGTNNPEYVGKKAVAEYAKLVGDSVSAIPVANTGGPGTAEGHWREAKFDRELMTGYAENEGEHPLSRMTIAALEDLGYRVEYSKSDAYKLPPPAAAAVTGLEANAAAPVAAAKNCDFPEVKVEGQEDSEGGCCNIL